MVQKKLVEMQQMQFKYTKVNQQLLVYVDATQGWINVQTANNNDIE